MPFRILLTSVLALVAGTGVFLLGRHSVGLRRDTAGAAEATASGTVAPSAEKRRYAPARQLPCLTLPAPPAVSPDEAEQEQARIHRAEVLLGDVFRELENHARRGTEPAETRADLVQPYLSGVLHGACQADPAMRSAFSVQFTSALCERTLAEDQAISVAHMAMMFPDIATPRGFDCFFSKAKENVPLWSMLDAWRRSGLEKSPVLAKLQASSTDSRTTRRFLSKEEAMAQRMPDALAAYRAIQSRGDSK